MKWLILISIYFISASCVFSQVEFSPLRYDDPVVKNKGLLSESRYKSIKYTSLGNKESTYASFGGEVRYQVQYFNNEDWGETPKENYTATYSRFLLHSDLKLSKSFRLFGQLNSTSTAGRITPNRSIDQNTVDLHQAFVDITLLERKNSNISFRGGRQEMRYGSQRLVTVREGPNNRLSFDALKLSRKSKKMTLDLFYAHPVKQQLGVFDDSFQSDEKIWSSYAVIDSVIKNSHLDLYYIGFYNRNKSYSIGSAKELRHSLGFRWWKNDQLTYDIEAVLQFGEFGNQNIWAYTLSLNLNYQLENLKGKPTVGIKTEIISGDRDGDDQELNTFNPLFPRGAYFGLAALIGPANLIDLHPSISFELNKKLNLNFDYDLFWRYTLKDGIYGPNTALIFEEEGDERFIGGQVGVNLEYEMNGFFSFSPEFTWFNTGDYLKEVSPGKDIFFSAITAQLKF